MSVISTDRDDAPRVWRCRALLMAGGRSERMKTTSGIHKALMQVGGKPLIERNLETLLGEGFTDIVVAVASDSPEIEAYVRGRGCVLAKESSATVTCLVEESPLGTIGAARTATAGFDGLLVVNVDNLTTIPLRQFVQHHRDTGAQLTIASHTELFRIPFGHLVTHDGQVVEYREKPTFPVAISSGTHVLSPEAAHLIEGDRPYHITDLFNAAKAKGLKIVAFEHSCTWVDINDEPSLQRAEERFGTSAGGG